MSESFSEVEDLSESGIRSVVRMRCDRKIHFHTGSAVFPFAGLDVIKGVLIYVDQHEGPVKGLIAAHTDTQDSHANNQKLSDLRARSSYYVLMGKADDWAKLCHEESKGSKSKDIDDALAFAARARGWKCDQGAQPQKVKAFKEAWIKAHPKSPLSDTTSTVDADFWKRVFYLYSRTLWLWLKPMKNPPQGRSQYIKKLQWVDDQHPAIGCSERDPYLRTADNVAEEENRRVEFLFFKPGSEPKRDDPLPDPDRREPQDNLPPLYLEAVYDPQRYRFFDLECPRPTFMGHEIKVGNVLFIVDASGSMGQKEKWPTLKESLISAIDLLTENDDFGVLAYDTGVRVLWPNAEGGPTLKEGTDKNRKDAIAWVNEQASGGSTSMYLALDKAMLASDLRPIEPERGEANTIEFLTDGVPTNRKRKCEHCGECSSGEEFEQNTCPSCSKVNKSWRTCADWGYNQERDALIAQVGDLADADWVVNLTAFLDKPDRNSQARTNQIKDLLKKMADRSGGQISNLEF